MNEWMSQSTQQNHTSLRFIDTIVIRRCYSSRRIWRLHEMVCHVVKATAPSRYRAGKSILFLLKENWYLHHVSWRHSPRWLETTYWRFSYVHTMDGWRSNQSVQESIQIVKWPCNSFNMCASWNSKAHPIRTQKTDSETRICYIHCRWNSQWVQDRLILFLTKERVKMCSLLPLFNS